MSYPTSASGIVLLQMPTKYREFFPSLFVKQPIFISTMAKPIRALELHYPRIQFLIIGVTGLIERKCKKTHRVIILPHIWEAWPLFLPCYKLSYVLTSD